LSADVAVRHPSFADELPHLFEEWLGVFIERDMDAQL
jgi:hypothetical protein